MNELAKIDNPFGNSVSAAVKETGMIQVEQERAIQEVQASMVIAKKFPRNQMEATDKILQACNRPSLAENAVYAYPRGGSVVTGPSIRLAEAMAQNWGNMQFGIRELSQENGESSVEAFAWDVETNTRQVKVFQVPHIRFRSAAKGGPVALSDPRDIYELVANQGARRLRACILGVIPGDVIDAALKQCEVTQSNNQGVPAETIKELVEAFSKFNVTKEMIIERLGHRLDSVIGAEVLQMKRIYVSLRDGMAKPVDFFTVPEGYTPAPGGDSSKLNESLKKEAAPKKKTTAKKQKPATEKEPAAQGETECPASVAPQFSYAEIADLINQGDLDLAEDLLPTIKDKAQVKELTEILTKAKETTGV